VGLDRIDQTSLPLDHTYHYPSSGGAGVHVYVIDSGIHASHTEFGGRVSGGYDFIDGDSDPDDEFGHGTAVASIIGGSTYGVAKDVYLHAVRVLNYKGKGSITDVVKGLDWVISNHSDPAVINMSLGMSSISTTLNSAIAKTVAAGITVVVASGNKENDSDSYDACDWSPASAASAIAVGATTISDARASYSTYGSCVDIFAPGSGILCAYNGSDTDWSLLSGTSLASPMVAGAAALYLADHTSATPSQVRAALEDEATADVLTIGSNSLAEETPNLLLAVFSNDVAQITLSSPADGAATNQTTVSLEWNAGYIGNTYELQVDDSSSFDSLFYTTTTEDISADVSGLTEGIWYWRVRASNTYGTTGEWSAPYSFTVDLTPPSAPSLTAPADGTYSVSIPAFAWSTVDTAAYYQFEYGTSSSDPDNTYVLRSAELSTNTYTPSSMTKEVQYYWFARAKDAAGNWSGWSSPRAIMIVPAAPSGPVLSSPANARKPTTPRPNWFGLREAMQPLTTCRFRPALHSPPSRMRATA
jgi:hypothetical protein